MQVILQAGNGSSDQFAADAALSLFFQHGQAAEGTGITMQAANKTTPSVPSFLVTDAEGMRKYGMGRRDDEEGGEL